MADVNKEIALKVTTDVGQTTSAFKSAKQELRETQKALVDLALAGKQGSAEFKVLEQRAGVIKDTIGDMGQRVNNLANDTPKLELLTQAATGIAGGFAVAQGAAALFGDENENVQQAILKTQAAMSLLNGVQSIANILNKDAALGDLLAAKAKGIYTIAVTMATAATRSFSAALAATGIGALLVGLGLLVAKFIETSAATKQSNLDLEEAAKRQKQLGDEIALTNKLRQSEIDLAAAAGASAKQTALDKIALTRDNIVEKQKEIDAEQKLIDQIEVNKTKVIDAQKAILDVLIKQKEDKKTLLQAELNDLNAKLQTELSVIKEANAIDAEANAKLRERMRLASVEFIDLQAKKIQSVRDTNATELQINKDGLAAQLKIEQEARDIQEAKQKEYNANKLADQQAVENGIKEMIRGSFQSIADISAAFAGDNEERQRKAFEIQKVAAIAGTVIDTYSAAQAAFKSASQIPIIGAVAGPIAAAAAIAAGLARVAAIKRTEFKAASSSAAPQAVRPAGLPQGGQQPPAAFTPNVTNPNPTGQPNPQGGQNGTTRVIVVESDIRRVTTRVDAAERFATFGN
jgi:hypothetical protein